MANSIDILIHNAISEIAPESNDQLFNQVYHELCKIARSQRRQWHGNKTLNTTALVHEAYIKLAGQDEPQWQNKKHFYATAAKVMRHILVNYAQSQSSCKRGGNLEQSSLDSVDLSSEDSIEDLLSLNQLLGDLESVNHRRSQIVECRVFLGMTVSETAKALDISPATIKREWTLATTWLHRAMKGHVLHERTQAGGKAENSENTPLA